MDKNRVLLLWVAGGAGIILLYAAYKGKSPSGILTTYATGTPQSSATPTVAESAIVPPTREAQFVTDINGLSADVPAAYSSNPDLYIPPVGTGG